MRDSITRIPENLILYIWDINCATLFLKTVIDILDMCVIILKEAYTTLF